MWREFLLFLKQFNVAALAVGFVMGTASTTLVNSLVKDIFMPILTPLMSVTSWKDAKLVIGPVVIAYGNFLAELFNFLILAIIIFFMASKLLKIEVKKK